MTCEILIIAEHNEGKLDPMTTDLIACGSKIASEKQWKLGVLVLGFDLDRIVEEISSSGIDLVLVVDDNRVEEYNSSVYLAALAQILREATPRLVLAGHSYIGIELASGLAPKLKAPMVANCHSIDASSNGFLLSRSMFGGKFLATIEVNEASLLLLTLSKDSSVSKRSLNHLCEIERKAYPEHSQARVKVIGTTRPSRAEDITQAEVIVAVGRGIRDESQISLFRELAEALGGAIAASRPLVDSGWLTNDHQVGISGVTVRPKVYLAFGISGSAQHVAGMKQSRLIIAINNDPSAPIFQVAHYGVVGDLFEIVPPLLEIAKEQSKGRNL